MNRRLVVLATAAVAVLVLAIGAILYPQFAGNPRAATAEPVAPSNLVRFNSPVIGPQNAPVTIVEYASLTCSHCADFHANTYPALKEKYIDTGKVRLVFREFPLDPLAAAGFMLARCRPSDQYFDMVDLLFDKQRQWAYAQDPVTALLNLAKQAGFTQESFEECLTNQELLDAVNEVKDKGVKDFGVTSTPTFFINGRMLRGARGIDEFSKVIDPELNG